MLPSATIALYSVSLSSVSFPSTNSMRFNSAVEQDTGNSLLTARIE